MRTGRKEKGTLSILAGKKKRANIRGGERGKIFGVGGKGEVVPPVSPYISEKKKTLTLGGVRRRGGRGTSLALWKAPAQSTWESIVGATPLRIKGRGEKEIIFCWGGREKGRRDGPMKKEKKACFYKG